MEKKTLPTRTLGRTGKTVSALGLGGAALTGSFVGRAHTESESIACVLHAIERGITYLDTSPLYGDSERRMGLALARSGGARKNIFLATKTGTGTKPHDYSGDGTRKSVAQSLERLQTDYLDLVQVHDPSDLTPVFASGGALDALVQLKAEGIIGAIGMGVRSHDFLRRAIDDGRFDTILTYADFNPVQQTARDTLFGPAHEKGLGLIIGSPLLFGWLTNRPLDDLVREHGNPNKTYSRERVQAVRDWCDDKNISPVALSLQFILRETRVSTILVGAGSPDEIEENLQGVTNELPKETWDDLQKDLGIC